MADNLITGNLTPDGVVITDTGEKIGSFIKASKNYLWKPQLNITAYELALCVPIISGPAFYGVSLVIEALPDCARRHFSEME